MCLEICILLSNKLSNICKPCLPPTGGKLIYKLKLLLKKLAIFEEIQRQIQSPLLFLVFIMDWTNTSNPNPLGLSGMEKISIVRGWTG